VLALALPAAAADRPSKASGTGGGLSAADVALPSSLSVTEAATLLQSGREMVLLDVRTDGEFARGHLPGAMHIPIRDLPRRLDELAAVKGKQIVVYCRTKNRSVMAQTFLARMGYRASYIRGGVKAWQSSKRPLFQ